ncbi:MAG: glycosyltransferase family 4 protein [Acidimicrobiales bacterium]
MDKQRRGAAGTVEFTLVPGGEQVAEMQRTGGAERAKILHLTTAAISHRLLLLPQLLVLRDAGHDVGAVSADGPEVDQLRHHGIRHRVLEGSTRSFDVRADMRAVRSFASILRDEAPDIVHTHNPKTGVYGRILARALGVPRVVNTVHGLYATPQDPARRRAVVYGLEAVAARCSHLELVQNIEDFDLMARTPLAPSANLRYLGNGIDVRTFMPDDNGEQRAAVRAELGIAPDAVVVASVGRLVAEKGFRELLAASADASSDHTVVIIGPDDPRKADALDRSVADAARRRGVRFLGHRSDIARLLPAFDLFVLASYREGFPRAAMEAAACGLPIVATDIRGCRQVVDHETTGLLVPSREVKPLRGAIERLVANADLRTQWGTAARAKAEAEFDERLILERLFAGYAELGITSPDQAVSEVDVSSPRFDSAAG